MNEIEKKDALDYIKGQLEYGYIDLSIHDENEIEVIRKAINVYTKIPVIIEGLKKAVYYIDDSATLSSRNVINEGDVFNALESLLD